LHSLNLLSNSHSILLATISNLMSVIQLIITDILLLIYKTIPIIEIIIFILNIFFINLLNKDWQSLFTFKFKSLLNKIFIQLFTRFKIIILIHEILIFFPIS
jgi:hypothetical protein